MKKKLIRFWNSCSKGQKYLIVVTVWLIQLFFYLLIPVGMTYYFLKLPFLALSCLCGYALAAIEKGDI